MARLDIKSFEDGIKQCDEMIAKWKAKRERLKKKIENTIECPKCHCHWDKLYIRKQLGRYSMELECPLCLQTIKKQETFDIANLEREYPTQEYMYNVATKNVEKVKRGIQHV